MVIHRRLLGILLRHVPALAVALAIVACSGVSHGQGAASIGNPLRYRWQPGSGFGYEVDISADLPDAVETYKGNISYNLEGTEGDLLKITYNGGLRKTETPKQQASGPRGDMPFFGPPAGPPGPFYRNPFQGLEQTSNTILMTPLGRIRSLDGSSQLPVLLGNLSILPIEKLPEANETSWQIDSGATLTEANDKLGEPGFGPGFGPAGFSPFARPKSEKRTSASVVTSYRVEQSQGELVVIAKTFQMNSPGADESIQITGSGKWTFNRALGIPEKLDFQQKLVVNVKNVTFTVPTTIKYRRYADAEWKKLQEEARLARDKATREAKEAQAKAEAKAAAEAVIPLTPKERRQVVADIASSDFWKVKGALDKLASKTPQEPDPKIIEAILSKVEDSNLNIKHAAWPALKKWAPEVARKIELNQKYADHWPVASTERPVTETTTLVVGQIIQARDYAGWHPAEIKEVLADGKVKLVYRGRGGGWAKDYSRSDIQLAPDEVDQPNLDAQTLAQLRAASGAPTASADNTPAWRTWTDNTGSFSVEAQFLGVSEGKVQLRRKDGREVLVPLERLSESDRQEVQKLQQSAGPTNPFG